MKTIEELNFTRPIYNFLKRNNINTLEDIKKIDYDLIKDNKDIYNALVSRLHTEKILFDFEIPFYEIIKKRLINKDYVRVDELTISAHTKTGLNKLNINYVDELLCLDMTSLKQLRNNELGEVLYLLQIFNINLSEVLDDKLIILNQRIDELILTDKTIFELKALGCSTLSDYIHKVRNKSIKSYLSNSSINEIENKINEFMFKSIDSIEINIENYKMENKKLNDINEKRTQKLLKLEFLKNQRERLMEESKKIDREFSKLMK